jgi:DNA-binding response OmpR family regulator
MLTPRYSGRNVALTTRPDDPIVALLQPVPLDAAHGRQALLSEPGPAWLVLADGGPAAEILALAPLRSVRVTREPAEFRALLLHGDPSVVVCGEPPASAAELELLAVERAKRPWMRIVHVSATADVERRLAALRAGFDDALPNSISAAELAGRLALQDARVLDPSRRGQRIRFGDGLELDLTAHDLRRHGRPVHLRPKEFGLLALLACSPGRAWTREELLAHVWGATASTDERGGRTVDVHVRWLRAKIEADPDQPTCLVTVRGVGYRLDGPER